MNKSERFPKFSKRITYGNISKLNSGKFPIFFSLLIDRGVPTRVPLKVKVTQVAAGGHHTVAMTASGQVYTFGAYMVSTVFHFELSNSR